MNTKLIVWLGGTVLVLLALMIWASPQAQPASSGSPLLQLHSQETSFDFGQVSMAGGKVRHSFSVENDTSSTVRLGRLYTSCMCTEATWTKDGERVGPFGMPGHGFLPPLDQELRPGESASVEAEFDPAAHGPAGLGRVDRQIILESENGQTLAELSFSANVIP